MDSISGISHYQRSGVLADSPKQLLRHQLLLWTLVPTPPLRPAPQPSPIFTQAACLASIPRLALPQAQVFLPTLPPSPPGLRPSRRQHLPQGSQKSPLAHTTPCGQAWPCGYFKSASCYLYREFGQPPTSNPGSWHGMRMTTLSPCSHFWCQQIFQKDLSIIFKNSSLEKEMNIKTPLSKPVKVNTAFL